MMTQPSKNNVRTLWILLGIATGWFWCWAISLVLYVPWWIGGVIFLMIVAVMMQLGVWTSRGKS